MNHKETYESFAAFLQQESSQDFVFACHVSPDGDTIGSAVALALYCRALGKRATVYIPDTLPSTYAFLEPLFSEGAPFSPKTVVSVDVSTAERLGDLPECDRVDFCIDHHMENTVSCARKLVDPSLAATGQIVAATLAAAGFALTAEIARALYIALSTDTGCFRHANTSPEVFALAETLCAAVPEHNFADLNRRLFVQKPAELLLCEAYAVAHAHRNEKAGYVFFAVTDALKRRFHLDGEGADLSSLIDALRAFPGFDAYFLAKQKGRGVYKVSVRTENGADANAICKQFSGGGHVRAAGCTIRGSQKEVEKSLSRALSESRK